MAKPRRAADDGLFALPAGRRGRVETAVNAAVRSARVEKLLSDLDGGLVTLARACARAVDVAEAAHDVWAVARAAGELRDTLIRLRLDPTSRGADRDNLADFLTSLTEPAAGDPAGAGPLGHPPHPR